MTSEEMPVASNPQIIPSRHARVQKVSGWRLFFKSVIARAYPRLIGQQRERTWLFFDVFLPLLAVSAYVFVYRAIDAPEEYIGFVVVGGAMTAFWLNVLWSMSSQLYWEKEQGNLALYVMAPNSLMAILFGIALGGMLATTLRAIAIMVLGSILFQVQYETRCGRGSEAEVSAASKEVRPAAGPPAAVAEFTLKAVAAGVVLGIVFGASNAYLGLRVGLTVSASIPAAVMTVAVFTLLGRRGTILEANLSQTVGSASTSLASGTIFTIPALFMWQMVPPYLQIVVLSYLGAVLGLAAMIPLRRLLIVQAHDELPYPEGTACAEVLRATTVGASKGTSAFIVLSGAVEILKSSGDKEIVVATLGEGQVFGEMGLIEDRPRSATVRAMTELKLRVISREGFNELLQKKPSVLIPSSKACLKG